MSKVGTGPGKNNSPIVRILIHNTAEYYLFRPALSLRGSYLQVYVYLA
jgi:hypothetical protein